MPSFTFVQCTSSGLLDPTSRLLIRKQVMKHACLKRKTKPHRKLPLPPLFWSQLANTSIMINPSSPYDRLCSRYNLDLDLLSGLTCFGVCSPTVAVFADTTKLISLLGHRQDTFLRFVPSRYEIPCIAAATDCLLAKLSDRLHQTNEALPLYIKALQLVQQCDANADTMCAVMLLSLYELLDSNRSAFEKHIHGVAHLTRYLKKFTTDYEMMLLYSSLGTTVVESIMYWDHCYLEAPEWRRTLLDFATETHWLTNRSPLVVRVHLTEAHLPGFIKDTDLAVSGNYSDLLQRLKAERKELFECSHLFKAHLAKTNPPPEEIWLRREILGTLLEHLIINGRCIAAISDVDRLELESTTQDMARQLDNLINQPELQHAWLFSYHERAGVVAAQQTQHLFEQDFRGQSAAVQAEARMTRWKTYTRLLTTDRHPTNNAKPNATSRYGWKLPG